MNSSVINCTILITILIHPRRLYKILQTWKSFVYRGPRSTCDFERRKSREDVHRLLVNDPTKNDLNIVYLDPWDTHVLKLPAKQAFFINFLDLFADQTIVSLLSSIAPSSRLDPRPPVLHQMCPHLFSLLHPPKFPLVFTYPPLALFADQTILIPAYRLVPFFGFRPLPTNCAVIGLF